MVLCQNSREFVSKNNQKIQQTCRNLSKHFGASFFADDISQEVCLKILREKDLSSLYNPNYRGYQNRPSSINTYMFSTCRNAIISHQRKEGNMKKADFSSVEDLNDDQEYAIIHKEMDSCYRSLLDYNEHTEELAKELEDFNLFLLKNPRYNRKWTLKKTPSSKHRIFSTLKLWSYLRAGYSQKEIADLLGISTKMVQHALATVREAYVQYSKV